MAPRISWLAWALTTTAACLSEDHSDAHGETEVISRVTLTLTPQDGGDPVTVKFEDPDGDGGVSGSSEALLLARGKTFDLEVAFTNGLTEPPTDITREVEAEAEEHQVLFYGESVQGPASVSSTAIVAHAYADQESDYGENLAGDDLPLGIQGTLTTLGAGTAELHVMLRHLPPIGGKLQKSPDVAELAAMGRPLPGDVDADVAFAITVQ